MKLPSVSQIVDDARRSFARYPFAVLDAVIGTSCALVLIDHEGPPQSTFLFQVVFAAVFGFPLLAALALSARKQHWSSSWALTAQIAGIALSVVYGLTVPPDIAGAPAIHVIRLAMLTAAWVLFAFWFPYLAHQNERGYWQYGKTLVMRVVTAFIYSAVMWIGLSIALAALDNLFGVEIPPRRYGELWVLVTGVFAPWFFLAGIPEDLDGLDEITTYPKGLKVFAQYVLYPLVFLYWVILYAYIGKILLAWDWPQGWVSKLILGFVATGLTASLLLHPLRERAENLWIAKASRWFYYIIIPLIVMLFLAVGRRTSDYGYTEGRYLAIAAGVWLCVITLYYLVSAKKRILFIPATLCLGLFVVTFGPWGMFAISEQSQIQRLENLLTKNHVLVGGQVQRDHDTLSYDASREISSILTYLGEVHGFGRIQAWFSRSLLADSVRGTSRYKDAATVAQLMGIEYIRVWQNSTTGWTNFTSDPEGTLALDGYSHLLKAPRIYAPKTRREFPGSGITLSVGEDVGVLAVTFSRSGQNVDSLEANLHPLVEKLTTDYGKSSAGHIPPEKMCITAACASAKVKIMLSSISMQRRDKTSKIVSYEGEMAYTLLPGN